jgi:hypothetical protein
LLDLVSFLLFYFITYYFVLHFRFTNIPAFAERLVPTEQQQQQQLVVIVVGASSSSFGGGGGAMIGRHLYRDVVKEVACSRYGCQKRINDWLYLPDDSFGQLILLFLPN